MSFFPTSPLTSLSPSVRQTSHGVNTTKLPRLQVADDHMIQILVQMDNVLNILDTNQALSESLYTHVGALFDKNRPILQPSIEVPNLTK